MLPVGQALVVEMGAEPTVVAEWLERNRPQTFMPGIMHGDFHIGNVPARVRKLGDLWKPLLAARGRFRLERVL